MMIRPTRIDPLPPLRGRLSPFARGRNFYPPCKGGRPPRRASPIGRSINRSGRGSLTSHVLFSFGLALSLATSLFAHHLGQTVYDSTKKISLEGRVSKVIWENPHIYYELEVKDKDGKALTWELEGGEPNPMHRRGWNKDDLQVGDLLLVRDASMARDGSHRAAGGAYFKP